jgi:Domain of unknown function (DUF4430)
LIRHRSKAVASALLLAALATAGCGVGPGEGVGEARLTVTRDFGARQVAPPTHVGVSESDTVMRVLEREAEISTRFGGGFVSAIDGVAATARDGGRYDWFFFVDGVEASVGAADFSLQGGEAIWWDYRDWSAASRAPAVVGSFPRPLAGGYGGEPRPVSLECRGVALACATARVRLQGAGVELARRDPGEGAIRVLVGPWARLREDPAVAQVERGPRASGVFADFVRRGDGYALLALDERGEAARELGPDAGLVAAARRYDAPPVWLVGGTTARGAMAAAHLLDPAVLRGRYAVATERGDAIPLPVRR